MKTKSSIHTVKKLTQDKLESHYDIFIGFFGRESRATHAYNKISIPSNHRIAITYECDRPEYIENLSFLSEHAFTQFDNLDKSTDKLSAIIRNSSAINILIDISSSKKSDLSKLLYHFANTQNEHEITIDFVYSHAVYSKPSYGDKIGSNPEPIIAELTGYDLDFDRPSSLILGLGYEPNVALSFIEVIDPSRVWTFSPYGHDQKYESAVKDSNEKLFKFLENQKSTKLSYQYDDMYNTFERLESCVTGALESNRITIAPYGMKNFLLCTILVSIIRMPNVAVWHLRNEPESYKINRVADGNMSFLRTEWKII